jgi:CheY-like chemotaxis protein
MQAPSDRLVLVVDDRKDVAATLADMCRAYGFTAEVAEDDVAMLTLLQRHQPAGVIVDMLMPYQDGFEAMKEIALYNRCLPVMLVTGYGDAWLQMGFTLGRAQGLTTVHTAAKPVRANAVRGFLEIVSGGPIAPAITSV